MTFVWAWDEEDDEVDLSKLNREKEIQETEDDEYTDLLDELIDLEDEVSLSKAVEESNGDFNYSDLIKVEEENILSVLQASYNNKSSEDLHNRGTERELHEYIHITPSEREQAKEEFYRQQKETRSKPSPIATEESRSVVVSSSGMTLDEYFQNKRKSNRKKSIVEVAKESFEEKDNEWDENVYLRRKRAELENKNKEKKRRREVSSSSFLDKNRRGSRAERRLLKTLGIGQGDIYELISPNSSLTEREKAELLSRGFFGEKVKTDLSGNRYKYVTIGDIEYLHFLDRFKFSPTKTLKLALGKDSIKSVNGQLNKLKNMGLVIHIDIIGAEGVWTITKTGQALIGSNRKLVNKRQAEPQALLERLYVNHVASCLWSNKINILNLEDFPYRGKNLDGTFVLGEDIIPESDIVSSYGRVNSELNGNVFVKQAYSGEHTKRIAENWEIMWRSWENSGRLGASPDEIEGNEYSFMLFGDSDLSASFVIPDLVVRRPRDNFKRPRNIAIEVEKKEDRKVGYYIKKLMAYKMDNRVYSKVVYVTPSASIARKITEAAEKIDFDRFDVVPMMNEDGITKEKSPWRI